MGDQISITMQDGFELGAYRSTPAGQSKGVVVGRSSERQALQSRAALQVGDALAW